MSLSLSCPDDSFGPWAGSLCRGGFDFTQLFEEAILSILLSGLFIVAAPVRIVAIFGEPAKVKSTPLDWGKKVASICFIALSAALVGLWVTNSSETAASAITHTRATIPSASLVLVVSLLYAVLSALEHRSSIRPSFLTSIYLGLSVLCDSARARTLWLQGNASSSAIPPVFTTSLALRAIMLLLESTEKRSILLDVYKDVSKEGASGPYNLGVFYWLNSLFFTGYRKVLEHPDLYPLDDELRSEPLAKVMTKAWDNVPDKTAPGALFSAWIGAFMGPILMPVIPRIFQIGFTYAQPFLVTAAIELAVTPQEQPFNNNGYGLIGAYILVYGGIAVSVGQYEWRNYRAVTMMRGSVIPLVYQKSLLVDSSASSTFSPTAALTLVSTDIETISGGIPQLHETWSNLIEIGLAIYLLSRQLGAACVMGVGFAIVVMIGSIWLAAPTGAHQAEWIAASQRRVTTTSKAVGSIKWLKISGLSDIAFNLIQDLRTRELVVSTKFRLFLGISLILSLCTPILGPLLTFATAAGIALRSQSDLTISKIFTSFAIIVLLNSPLSKIIIALPQIAGAVTSFQRIQDHLNSSERKDTRLTFSQVAGDKEAREMTPSNAPSETTAVGDLDAASVARPKSQSLHSTSLGPEVIASISGKFSWPEETSNQDTPLAENETTPERELKEIAPVIDVSPRLDIPRHALTLILGPVGCGKSTLLKALLGELPAFDGSISAHFSGAITFCDQNPWLPNETVREIICGRPSESEREQEKSNTADDEAWYRTVVGACALERDIDIWPRGDKTPVGSKGISMSGGQKQRLSMARAVYARRELLVMDDCFSGLDANTEDLVFDNLLGKDGLLRKANMTIILTSSDYRRVPYADKIVLFNEHGQVHFSGTPDDLKQNLDLNWIMGDDHTRPANKNKDAKKTNAVAEASAAVLQEVNLTTEIQTDAARQMGDTAVYKFYAQSAGWRTLVVFVISIIVFAFCDSFPSIWLKWWAESNATNPNSDLGKWLGVYAALAIGAITACLFGTWQLFIITINRSGLYFHNVLVKVVSRAPMSYHTSTDSGITINRFSQDLQLIDMELPAAALGVTMALSFGVAQFLLICVSSRYMTAILPPLLAALYAVQHFYLRTARQLRLLDIEFKAPLYSQLMETVAGLVTIRAFHWESRSIAKSMKILDDSQQPSYLLYCVQRWLVFAVNVIIMFLAVVLVVLTTTLREKIGPGFVGIALSNILAFSATMQATINSWVQLEISLGAVARIRSFEMQVKSEDDEAVKLLAEQGRDEQLEEPNLDAFEGKIWPNKGHVELDGVCASYPSSGRVLDDISLSIQPGQKVGICGRTGSGKSSLFLSLLGLIAQDSGTITIDGVDLATLPREYLRSHLVAVPQEAYILDGTVRLNADPYHSNDNLGSETNSQSRDDEIIRVLERVGLWGKIKARGGLDTIIDEKFLSQGQAQLMVLARAMLRKGESRVLLLDEATSSLDESTSAVIDDVVRTWFQGWTVLAIAHKLDAILDYDKVVVLDAGKLVEFDEPRKLLAQEDSIFKDLYLLSTNSSTIPKSLSASPEE